jgi:hypothetical protein
MYEEGLSCVCTRRYWSEIAVKFPDGVWFSLLVGIPVLNVSMKDSFIGKTGWHTLLEPRESLNTRSQSPFTAYDGRETL